MQLRINNQKLYLSGLVLMFFGLVIWVRFRLLGLPLERDEGEYAYMAQQLLQGILPYTEVQSMKVPGIYFVYAGILTILGESSSAIHLSLIFVNLATAFFIFLLARSLLSQSAAFFAAVCFSVLTLSPAVQGVWANSEHFVLLFAVSGIFLLRIARDRAGLLFLSGLLLGSSLLIKQHAVFYCLFGALYLGFRIFSKLPPMKTPFQCTALFVIGGMTPLLLTAILYGISGNFSQFWFCTVQYASEYVSLTSLGEGFDNFKFNFAPIIESNFSILWLSLIGLASIAWVKDKNREYLFILGLFACLFLSITPGLYFRPHYFLLWMPALSILAGAGFEGLVQAVPSAKFKNMAGLGILVLALGIPFLIQKDTFFNLTISKVARLIYGLNPFPESLEVANYIREHSGNEDRVAILGSEPQIYFFSKRKAATRHIYMYPLMERHIFAREMQDELIREVEEAKPEFVVVVNLAGSWISSRSHISPMLKNWTKKILNAEYEIHGVVDILGEEETVYKWGEQAKKYHPNSRYHLLIHKRQ